jgi:anti-sigma B factor antagonist
MDIPGFRVEWSADRRVAILRIMGHIAPQDLACVEEAGNRMVAAGARHFVVDVSGAELISSTGIGLILYYRKILAGRAGSISVAGAHGTVRRLLEAARLDRAVPVYDTVAAALAAVDQDD